MPVNYEAHNDARFAWLMEKVDLGSEDALVEITALPDAVLVEIFSNIPLAELKNIMVGSPGGVPVRCVWDQHP